MVVSYLPRNAVLAQLGERLLDVQEVMSSSLVDRIGRERRFRKNSRSFFVPPTAGASENGWQGSAVREALSGK